MSENLLIRNDSHLNENKFVKFINSQQCKDLLKQNTETLIKNGGFGSPTFFYNNYMFFGNDRLELFEKLFEKGLLDS